jgi:hypothetical protein
MNKVPIKAIFKFNKLEYTLLQRNEYVALYGIGSTPEKEAERFEVFKIIIEHEDTGIIESVPSNDYKQIRESCLRVFNDYKSALKYFNKLTYMLRLYQGLSEVVSGVPEQIKMAA